MNVLAKIEEAYKENEESLDLSSLGLSQIPKEIVKLKKLKSLNLEKNLISDISILSKLKKLTNLNLFNNEIQDISPLSKLSNLERLDLAENYIGKITPLEGLKKLEFLDLSRNLVQDLFPIKNRILNLFPVKWRTGNFYTSLGAYVMDNPFIHPPLEIIQQSSAAVYEYFKEIEENGEVTVNEAKLLIIGEAGVGKTTLARKIQNPEAKMPRRIKDTTRGIDVYSHFLPSNRRNQGFTMKIWDFGGQAIYHTTHQLFLSKRSLYVMVLDGRKDENPQKYWLRVQELLGGDSPLLILTNVKDTLGSKIPLQELKSQFQNISDHFLVNLKNDRVKLSKFTKRIEREIRALPHLKRGETLPKKWLNIRKRLEAQTKKNYISQNEFREICSNCGIKDRLKQDFIGEYLHDLGIILHFKEQPVLSKMVILNTTWATDAVYNVLDHTKKNNKNGKFHRNILDEVWEGVKYEGVFEQLLALMENFELCYRLPNMKNYFIVPELLPFDPPDFHWEYSGNIQLFYKYDFLPKGVLTRLIVRLHHLIARQTVKKSKKGKSQLTDIVWKRGVLLKHEQNSALILENSLKEQIEIRVKGLFPRDLMGHIVHELEIINSTFKFREHRKTKVTKLIPCICGECSDANQPYFFSQEILNKAKSKGEKQIQCHESFQKVNLNTLLRDGFIKGSAKEIKSLGQVERLLKNNKFEEALSHLFELVDPEDEDLVLNLQGRCNAIEKETILGTLTTKELEQQRNELRTAAISIIKKLKNPSR